MANQRLTIAATSIILLTTAAATHHVAHAFSPPAPLFTRPAVPLYNSRGTVMHPIGQQRNPSLTTMTMSTPGAAGALTPSLISSAAAAVKAFSKAAVSDPSHALASITDAAMQTPPVAYFLALMAAGCGVPVSEDALCIFAGTVLPTLAGERRVRLLLALYLGVVMSDVCTFFIGRSLRLGVLDPVRRRLGIMSDEEEDTICALPEDGDISKLPEECKPKRRRKRDRLKDKLEKSGDWVGFVIRLSVGMRGPLMLLTGFSGRVPFAKFIFGSFLGGVVSVGLQLALGYSMRNNPAAVVGTVASISTVVYAGPLLVAVISSLALLTSNRDKSEK